MRFVTTCHRQGWEHYGHRLWESWDNAPEGSELIWYAEGFNPGEKRGITVVPTDKLHALQSFKLRYADYRAPSWRWDVSEFPHKVFAAIDGLMEHRGIGVWLDADCVIYKKMPQGWLDQFLPDGFYMSIFRRAGMYTETGFWMMDCAHKFHESFLSDWQSWYDSGEFKNLAEWHDCMTLDGTIRTYERENLIRVFSLSGQHEREMHPMASSPIAEYIDHCKGPRKDTGASPENKFREPVNADAA